MSARKTPAELLARARAAWREYRADPFRADLARRAELASIAYADAAVPGGWRREQEAAPSRAWEDAYDEAWE